MKKLCIAIALLALFGGTVHAACPTSGGPSAALMLPHFEADLSGSGDAALYAVQNAGPESVLVRAAVFSNLGDFAGAFFFDLGPNQTRTGNLRDLWSGQAICPGHFYELQPEHLSEVLDGDGDGTASGYMIFETVTACGLFAPGEPGYAENASGAAVLIGDRFALNVPSGSGEGALLLSGLAAGKHRVRFLRFPDGETLYDVFMPEAGAEPAYVPVSAFNEEGHPAFLGINFVGGLRVPASARVSLDYLGADGFGSLEFNCPLPCAIMGTMRASGYSVNVPAVPLDCAAP
jgi:hypothetical protein